MLSGKSAVVRITEHDAPLEISEGRYQLRLAQTADELDGVLRLRFEVFNLELGEGLASSLLTGRDEDEFDQTCDHLMVTERASGRVIGTYRLQTGEMAAAGTGFYSAGEFDLSHLPSQVLSDSIELGRACIAVEHRHTQVLLLLWRGIAAYLRRAGKRYLFGCCSLTGQDARAGQAVRQQLLAKGQMHRMFYAPPRPGFECWSQDGEGALPEVKIPKLFSTYLRVCAKVCGPPAIDRQFGTIDFLVLLDTAALDPFSRRLLFGK